MNCPDCIVADGVHRPHCPARITACLRELAMAELQESPAAYAMRLRMQQFERALLALEDNAAAVGPVAFEGTLEEFEAFLNSGARGVTPDAAALKAFAASEVAARDTSTFLPDTINGEEERKTSTLTLPTSNGMGGPALFEDWPSAVEIGEGWCEP